MTNELKPGDTVDVTRNIGRTKSKDIASGVFVKMDGGLAVVKLDDGHGGAVIVSQLFFVQRRPSPAEIAALTMAIKNGWSAGEERKRRGVTEEEDRFEFPLSHVMVHGDAFTVDQ